MRLLSLILPLILLAAFFFLREGEPAASAVRVVAPQEPAVVEGEAAGGVRWVSHDWVEPDFEDSAEKEAARRETFGLEPAGVGADCLDPNCRACLIDLVYGREF